MGIVVGEILQLLLNTLLSVQGRALKIATILALVIISNPAWGNSLNTVKKIQESISANLSQGDSQDVIEEYLASANIVYSYDKYSFRYQAIVRENEADCNFESIFLWLFYECAIQIYINLNERGDYKDHEVFQTYSGL
ncbi:hypothetical protein ACJJIL_08250 [Microbulbifer sp. EKSA005]|uniref:hypothetical protein n=1 Tax=Microbulbifer sp. EKSA005 TaxID=3243364 RepID=UPI0040425915